ncbi:MAG: hypothetical protein DRP68_04185 [Candidatus Omnitrophota bacterium]|nr:MAG: hypothetical protein DRP68_04185 [Candidatus Omnitrophota bacterium]
MISLNIPSYLLASYLKRIKGLNTPAKIINFALRRYRKRIVLIQPEKNLELSYYDLFLRVNSLIDFFVKKNLRRQEVISFYSQNCYEYFEVRCAAHLFNLVFFSIPSYLGEEEIIYFLKETKSKVFFYRNISNLDRIRQETEVELFIDLDSDEYLKITSGKVISLPKIKIGSYDLATLNLSSATTVKTPKIVKITNNNWIASLYNYILTSKVNLRKKIIFISPISLSSAGSTTFLPLLFSGATALMISEFSPSRFIGCIKKYEVNRIYLTASWFLELFDWCKINNERLISVENVIIGTERIPYPRLREAIEFFGPKISIGYGMVEALPPLTMLLPSDYYHKGRVKTDILRSVGRISKGVQLKILDKNYDPLSYGKIGKIAIKSETVSAGYLGSVKENIKHFKDGWFYSEDYGFIDENGFLYLLGRKEEVVIKGETFTFTKEIEDKLYKFPFIDKCVVIPEGRQIFLFLSLKERLGEREIKEKIFRFWEKELDKSLLPKEVFIKKKLPITPLGKLDIKKIREEVKSWLT